MSAHILLFKINKHIEEEIKCQLAEHFIDFSQ